MRLSHLISNLILPVRKEKWQILEGGYEKCIKECQMS